MSKVLNEEVKEVVVAKVRKLDGIMCDVCEKFIEAKSKRFGWEKYPIYFEVTTGHKDWGNDSHESIEHRDVCPDCINKFVADYLSDELNYSTTKYIEIETEVVYPHDISE